MPSRRLLIALLVATVVGLALLALDGTLVELIGTVLVVGALLIVIALIVVRLGPQSQPERDREAQAREEFDRTGSWPAE